MSRSLAALAIFMREFGLSLKSFDNRIMTQKTIYLCQLFGFDMGYRYNWYLRGPYSPALTADAFELEDTLDKFENVVFKPYVHDRLDSVRSLIDKHAVYGLDRPEWSELLASIHYLRHISPQPVSKSKDEVINLLCERKSYFKRGQAEQAWNELDQVGLIEKIQVNLT